MSTIIDNKIAVRVTNATEAAYSIKKSTQIADFTVVNPEQSKLIKPVEKTILSMIVEGDPDLTTYVNDTFRTNKPAQQNNVFGFPTPENFGIPDYHTPIQTQILTGLLELKEKETLNTKTDIESRKKLHEQFDWTHTQHATYKSLKTSNWRHSGWVS